MFGGGLGLNMSLYPLLTKSDETLTTRDVLNRHPVRLMHGLVYVKLVEYHKKSVLLLKSINMGKGCRNSKQACRLSTSLQRHPQRPKSRKKHSYSISVELV